MPVSVMKFVTVRAPATEYRLMCFAFGGSEEFFTQKGFGTPVGYVAAIVLGPNPALLIDTKFGHAGYALEKAGFYNCGDLEAAWDYILKRFDDLPENSVMIVKLSAGEWNVESYEST